MGDLAKGGAEGINRGRHFHLGSGDGGSPIPPRADGQDLGDVGEEGTGEAMLALH